MEGQKISVILVTSEFRGDYAPDSAIAFDIDTNITVNELVDKIFSLKTENNCSLSSNKFTDHIEIRICN